MNKRIDHDARGGAKAAGRVFCRRGVVFAALIGVLSTIGITEAGPNERSLWIRNNHTGEETRAVFKRNGRYDPEGVAKVNWALRDWRRNEATKMDPKLMDLVWEVYQMSGSKKAIHLVSAYRAPATNDMLRRRSSGVAQNSQHTHGKAMDFFLPDVPLAKLREIGLRMEVGGVGFYPTSGSPFIHLDTGSVRHWPRMTRDQLVRVFPKGGTLHIPSDGKPLPGYQQALAAYKSRGGAPAVALASASREEDDERPAANVVASARTVAAPVMAAAATAMPLPRRAPERPAAKPAAVAMAEANVPLPRRSPLPPRTAREAPAAKPADERFVAAVFEPPAGNSRPVRAVDAISQELLRTAAINQSSRELPRQAMAFASAGMPMPETRRDPIGAVIARLPTPQTHAAPNALPASVADVRRDPTAELSYGWISGQGFARWASLHSTRQRFFADFSMPTPMVPMALIAKPDRSYAEGFSRRSHAGLRTDRFAGNAIGSVEMVTLAPMPALRTANR